LKYISAQLARFPEIWPDFVFRRGILRFGGAFCDSASHFLAFVENSLRLSKTVSDFFGTVCDFGGHLAISAST